MLNDMTARCWYSKMPSAAMLAAAMLLALLARVEVANAQLRIVTYNTTGGPRAGTETILRAIGEESRNAVARPIDVLLLQEQNGPFGDTQAFVNLLNSMYGAGIYDHGDAIGGPPGSFIRQTIVYNTQTVDLVAELAFGNTSGSTNLERQVLRYQLRPVGYSSAADFYAYNSHYKASQDNSPPGPNASQRNAEATAIRANYNALGAGTHAIYAGDHNFYYADSREPAVGTLTAAGAGQAIDPLNRVGNWHTSSSFADVHTQSPCSGTCPFVSGGMDDRFDFQWVTDEFLDGEGLSYIDGSYHAFGNNGTTYNGNINAAGNTVTFNGVTSYTKQQILDALWASSDHLPVVADYQVPAVLEAVAGSYPATLSVGQEFNLELTVSNAADVVAAIGADELFYSVVPDGNVVMGDSYFSQEDMALGDGNVYQFMLDTSSPGMKSGAITVASPPERGTANPMVTLDIMYEVVTAALYGDYNEDDIVSAADYTMWRDHLGAALTLPNEDPSASPGLVDMDDYDVWIQHFGQTLLGSGAGPIAGSAGGAVPEPGAWALLVLGVCLLPRRVATLKAWTRGK